MSFAATQKYGHGDRTAVAGVFDRMDRTHSTASSQMTALRAIVARAAAAPSLTRAYSAAGGASKAYAPNVPNKVDVAADTTQGTACNNAAGWDLNIFNCVELVYSFNDDLTLDSRSPDAASRTKSVTTADHPARRQAGQARPPSLP